MTGVESNDGADPSARRPTTHIELFAGGGGLALGLHATGFTSALLVEADALSCETLRRNATKDGGLRGATVECVDVREIEWDTIGCDVTLLAAGAPCQPFSLGGKHRAHGDERNLLPEVLRAIRSLRPGIVLIENVRGLTRRSLAPFFEYVLRQLESPSLEPSKDEAWQDHDRRLTEHMNGRGYEPEYSVSRAVLNAADYGVPQVRHRVFVVALAGAQVPFHFPQATHSRAALEHSQATGEYWDSRGLRRPSDSPPRTQSRPDVEPRLPWKTVRDALDGLAAPGTAPSTPDGDHLLVPGARRYVGHEGSPLDWPSKTIKAGVHGVPGGENMVVLDDGSVRYYTLREAARIQTFPDDYRFSGSRSNVVRQIGNAVPCRLAHAVAAELKRIV